MFTIVQSPGRIPAAIDLLNSCESGSAIHSAPSFSSRPGSWSEPLDFVTLILCSSSCTSRGVNVIASSDSEFLSLRKQYAASSIKAAGFLLSVYGLKVTSQYFCFFFIRGVNLPI